MVLRELPCEVTEAIEGARDMTPKKRTKAREWWLVYVRHHNGTEYARVCFTREAALQYVQPGREIIKVREVREVLKKRKVKK